MKKPYSSMETRILNAIPEDGARVNTLDLVVAAYVNDAPLSARQSVLDATNKLITKVDFNDEQFELFRSQPRGPMPIYFWREVRRTKVKGSGMFRVEKNK